MTEQLLYEMGDPNAYITPDVVADFTTIHLEQDGPDRVRVFGVKGRPATDKLKVSIAYRDGFKAVGTLVYCVARRRRQGAAPPTESCASVSTGSVSASTRSCTEFVGWNATHGPLAGPPPADLPEVQLRVGVRGNDRAPSNASRARSRRWSSPARRRDRLRRRTARRSQEIVAYWPALIDRREIEPNLRVEVTEA